MRTLRLYCTVSSLEALCEARGLLKEGLAGECVFLRSQQEWFGAALRRYQKGLEVFRQTPAFALFSPSSKSSASSLEARGALGGEADVSPEVCQETSCSLLLNAALCATRLGLNREAIAFCDEALCLAKFVPTRRSGLKGQALLSSEAEAEGSWSLLSLEEAAAQLAADSDSQEGRRSPSFSLESLEKLRRVQLLGSLRKARALRNAGLTREALDEALKASRAFPTDAAARVRRQNFKVLCRRLATDTANPNTAPLL